MVSVGTTGATMKSERNFEVRIYGTEGMIFQELWKGHLEYHTSAEEVLKKPDLSQDEIYPLHAPTENFVDLVAEKTTENGSPAYLGHLTMQMIDAACHSADSSKNITINKIRK